MRKARSNLLFNGGTTGGESEELSQFWPLFIATLPPEDPWNPTWQPLNAVQGPERSLRLAWTILHHEDSLRSLERQFQMAGLFSWTLVVLRPVSEHGSSMLCKQADYSLGRFSKPAICTAGLGSNFRRAPSPGPGLCSAADVKRSPPHQSHVSPHMVSPGGVPDIPRLPVTLWGAYPTWGHLLPTRGVLPGLWSWKGLSIGTTPQFFPLAGFFPRTTSAAVSFENPIKGNKCVRRKEGTGRLALYYFKPWLSQLSELKNDCIFFKIKKN